MKILAPEETWRLYYNEGPGTSEVISFVGNIWECVVHIETWHSFRARWVWELVKDERDRKDGENFVDWMIRFLESEPLMEMERR